MTVFKTLFFESSLCLGLLTTETSRSVLHSLRQPLIINSKAEIIPLVIPFSVFDLRSSDVIGLLCNPLVSVSSENLSDPSGFFL